jgi:hypothetical protein
LIGCELNTLCKPLTKEYFMQRCFLFAAVAMFSGALIVGCSAKPSAEDTSQTAPATSAETSSQTEMSDAMANLSPEDRALAEAQKICPVSNEPLGSMGEPIKVTVDDRSIFVCCQGCVEELKANFAKYAHELSKRS